MEESTGFIKKENLLFKRKKVNKAIDIIFEKCLAVKQDESVLIVYDKEKERLANKFFNAASIISSSAELVKIPLMKVNGQEPSAEISKKILSCDVAVFLTTKSLSHTSARRKATEKGVRIASMPNITESVLARSIDIDYTKLKKETARVVSVLNKARNIRVTNKFGTDITFSVYGRKGHGLSAGIYDKKGKWGNLPEGEAFIAPVEGTAYGVFVADGSIAGFGKLRHPLVFFVENGFVTKICDGKKPPQIEKLLNSVGKKARNIAEFGIGLNHKAKVTGIVLEDEKVYGTCHIALGNNIGFGGNTDVPLHIDCVITKPNIYVDEKRIMQKGKLLI